MSKFAATLMNSRDNLMSIQNFKTRLAWFLVVAILIAYVLPWIVNPGVGLTLNAYDLAEWASLAPGARSSPPALFATLLLRLPLVWVAFLTASLPAKKLWINVVLILTLSIALLPPFEFFRNASDDPNYRQQFALAGITVIGGMLILSFIPPRIRPILAMLFTLASAVSGIWGVLQAYSIMQQFALSVNLGFGIVLLALISLCVADLNDWNRIHKKQGSPGMDYLANQ